MISDMFTATFQTSVLTAPVIAAMLLLGNRIDRIYHVKGKCLIWLMVAVRLLLPFSADAEQAAVSIRMSQWFGITDQDDMRMESAAEWEKVIAEIGAESQEVRAEMTADSQESGFLSVTDLLACIWATGCITLAFYFFINYQYSVGAIRLDAYPCGDSKTWQILNELEKELGLHSGCVKLQKSFKVKAPMLIGFWKTVIILPEKEYKERELYFILKHELIHYLHRDIWKKLLTLSACVLHWFNPLCWLMHRQATLDQERCCDSNVIDKSDFGVRKEYSQILLNFLEYSNRIMILTDRFDGGARKMRKRIENIMKMGKRKGRVLTAAAAVVLLGTSQIAFGESVAEPAGESVGSDLVENGKNGISSISLEAVAEDSYYEVARKRYDAFTEGTNYISYSVYADLTAEQMDEIGRLEYMQLQSGDMDIVDECSLAFYEEDSDVLIYAFIYDKDGVHTDREDAVYVSGKTFVRFEPEETED